MSEQGFPLSPPARGGDFRLSWPGVRPFTHVAGCRACLREAYGKPLGDWINRLYLGENLRILGNLLERFRGRVNLVYIDPPFNSRAEYRRRTDLGELGEYYETEFSDVWNEGEYADFLYRRLLALRELLAEDGLCCVHCDFRVNWLVRALCEEIFGAGRLVNEIIWHYTGGGRSSSRLSRKHDTLLLYAKSGRFPFYGDAIREPYKKGSSYARSGITSRAGKKYFPHPAGAIPDDVWDIPIINPLSGERLGYPTQKPEALLMRLLAAFSKPDDLILDCFMGSGAALAAAMKMGRRFIGADCSRGALQTSIMRLAEIGALNGERAATPGFEVYEAQGWPPFRNPAEARKAALSAYALKPLPGARWFDGRKDGWLAKVATGSANLEFAREAARRCADEPGDARGVVLIAFGVDEDIAALDAPLIFDGVETRIEDFSRKASAYAAPSSEAVIALQGDRLKIEDFRPGRLLRKLEGRAYDWREFAACIAVDAAYDGKVFRPGILDFRKPKSLARGEYELGSGRGRTRVKIIDVFGDALSADAG